MGGILTAVKLDFYTGKSILRLTALLTLVAAVIGAAAHGPEYAMLFSMVFSVTSCGSIFSINERNHSELLYGSLPLKKSEMIIGRYLFALIIGVVYIVFAAALGLVISRIIGAGSLDAFSFWGALALGFIYFAFAVGVAYPVFFRFPFSKANVVTMIPMYIIAVLILFTTRRTNAAANTGQAVNFLKGNLYLLPLIGILIGLILLAVSALIAYSLNTQGEYKGGVREKAMAYDPQTAVNPKRLFFLDNLRIWLTVLVVLHHLSVIYAANTSFYYLEPAKNPVSAVVLVFFQLFNEAYFMGMFFFLSGYFTPASFDRKGAGKFFADRLLRLGIPLLAFYFLLSPIASIAFYQMPSSITGVTGPFTWRMGVGPLWFAALLLVFDAGYMLWRLMTKDKPEQPAKKFFPPKFLAILLFVLALAAVSYLTRIFIPFAKYILFFPSLAYLPQYISFFVLGTLANRRGWLYTIPAKYGKRGFAAAVVSILLFLIAISRRLGSPTAYLGGGTWQSGLYALWDSIFSVGLGFGLVVFFRRFFNHQKAFGNALAKGSFAVYVIHCPIIALTAAFALRGIQTLPLLKFCLAAVICAPLCFAAAWLIRKIPYVSKIL